MAEFIPLKAPNGNMWLSDWYKNVVEANFDAIAAAFETQGAEQESVVAALEEKISDSTWNMPDLVKFKGAIELDSDTYTTAKLNAKNASLFDTLESPLRGMYWYYVKAKTMDGYTQDSSGNLVQSPYYMPWGILIDVPYPFDGENIEQAEQKEGNPNVIPSPVIDDGSSYTRLQRLELMTSPTSEKRRVFVRRLVRTPDILGNYGEPEWEEWKKADAELATKKYVDSKISAEKVSVVDSLADESSDKALSANQGKILNEKITDIISNELQIGAEDGKFSAGGANANDGGVAIGNDAGTESGVSINENATTRSGVAIGKDAYSYSGVAIGNGAKTLDSEPGGTAIGTNAKSADGGFAGGKNAKAIYSLTEGQTGETPLDAIQLGEGTNNTPKTFQVYDHQMMDSDGNIPFDRLTNSKSYTDDIFSLAAEKAKAIPHTTAEGQSVKITDQLAGEELLKCNVHGCGNLVSYPFIDTTKTTNGVTFTDNGDGSITVNGTATANAIFIFNKYSFTLNKNKTYILSGNAAVSGTLLYLQFLKDGTPIGTQSVPDAESGILTLPTDDYDEIYVKFAAIKEYTFENIVITPKLTIVEGVGDLDGTSGKYKIPVMSRGKNMLKIINGYRTFGGDIPNTIIDAKNDAAIAIGRVVPNSSYVFTSINPNDSGRYFFYTNYPVGTSEKAIGGVYYGKQAKMKINVPKNANYIVFRVTAGAGTAVLENLQLESGTTSTEYEPYTETTATAVLDTALGENDYIDIIEKKRYTNGTEVSDITVEGELKTADSSKCEIECQTNVQPSKISTEYYQDINKVITEIKNAVLSQGGNV